MLHIAYRAPRQELDINSLTSSAGIFSHFCFKIEKQRKMVNDQFALQVNDPKSQIFEQLLFYDK